MHGPSLHLCAILCSQSNKRVEIFIEEQLVIELRNHLQGEFAKEAAWVALRITAAGREQDIETLLSHGLHTYLVKLLSHGILEV